MWTIEALIRATYEEEVMIMLSSTLLPIKSLACLGQEHDPSSDR
jgi:hypothetical protein